MDIYFMFWVIIQYYFIYLDAPAVVIGSFFSWKLLRYIVTSESFNQARWDIKDHVFSSLILFYFFNIFIGV